MMDRLSSGNRIYDVYFNTCYRKCMSSNRDYYLFNFLRAVALAIFLLIDIFALHSQSYLAQLFLGLSIGYNLVNTLKAFIFEKVYLKDEGKILAFAMQINHVILIDEPISQNAALLELDCDVNTDTGLKVSKTIYDFINMEKIEDVQANIKTMRENQGSAHLKNSFQKDICCFVQVKRLLYLVSVSLFIFGMVVIFSEPINEPQHYFIMVYLILEVFFRIILYTGLVLLALSPVICLVLCIYMCLCKRNQPAVLPAKVKATVQLTTLCNQCPICYQPITIGDQIIVLPCATNHIFHDLCIVSWTKVKSNCPICRRDLS